AQAARAQLDFLVRAHELSRVVLLPHFGCAVYGHRLGRPAAECLPAQVEDLRVAATTLRRWYPGMLVEGYLAMRSETAGPGAPAARAPARPRAGGGPPDAGEGGVVALPPCGRGRPCRVGGAAGPFPPRRRRVRGLGGAGPSPRWRAPPCRRGRRPPPTAPAPP